MVLDYFYCFGCQISEMAILDMAWKMQSNKYDATFKRSQNFQQLQS